MTTKLKAANLNATYSADEYLKTSAAGALSWGAVDALPSQTSQSGKFLTTDGSDSSWATVDALPSQTSESGKFLTTDGSDASWATISTTSYPSDAWTFRLTTGFNGTQSPVTNGFTKIQYLGSDTFADPSSGVFTFPSTGVWYIRFQSSFSNNSSYYQSVNIFQDTGAGQTIMATGYGHIRDSNAPAGIATISAFFDVTDVSTHKCQFGISASNAGMSTLGGSANNLTYIEFVKIGPT